MPYEYTSWGANTINIIFIDEDSYFVRASISWIELSMLGCVMMAVADFAHLMLQILQIRTKQIRRQGLMWSVTNDCYVPQTHCQLWRSIRRGLEGLFGLSDELGAA